MLRNEKCSTLVFAQFKGDVLNLPNVDFAVYRLEKSMSQHNPTDIDLLHALTAMFDSIQQLFSQKATDICETIRDLAIGILPSYPNS